MIGAFTPSYREKKIRTSEHSCDKERYIFAFYINQR